MMLDRPPGQPLTAGTQLEAQCSTSLFGQGEKTDAALQTDPTDESTVGALFAGRWQGRILGSSLQWKIRRAEVVSLDVFDTAVLRGLERPEDLFRLMRPAVSRAIGGFYHLWDDEGLGSNAGYGARHMSPFLP
jgi:hypothetical protein